jgi:hypothetical protein
MPCTDSGSATSCIDILNCNVDTTFFDTAFNDGPTATQYFDDYIVWGSNLMARAPVNRELYTSGSTKTCAASVCEPWCAACTVNLPSATATTVGGDVITAGWTLCRKVINSNSTLCTATCYWSGTITASSTFYPCP